jgi:xanthine dehydrogenase accessory factor
MRSQLNRILEAVLEGRGESLTLEAEGKSYRRRFQPPERLILLGGGHVALHVQELAQRLDFAVTVVDDRAAFSSPQRFPTAAQTLCSPFSEAIQSLSICSGDYVAVMTRGHRCDADCLRTLLAGEQWPRYVGMLASRKRGITLLAQLGEEGFRRERLGRIHTPIGLDINAMTLEEIAVSIVAELVQERRAGTPRRSKSVELTQTDPDQEVLEFVKDPEPKALVVVVETMGSTPVKTGALLAVDRNLRSAGTMGGGCAESACIRQARQLIGTGEQKLFPVSLNEPDAEEQGMACGGSMQVLAIDLG